MTGSCWVVNPDEPPFPFDFNDVPGPHKVLNVPRRQFDGPARGNDVKIAIVGTGAMGSVYAGLFAKAGHEVWESTWPEHIDAIAPSSLTVSGASGSFVVDNLTSDVHPTTPDRVFVR